LFKALVEQDPVLQGRFFVAEGYGNDLNANNFDNVIKDAVGAMTTAQKYPVAILFPPVEVIAKGYDWNWSQFRLKMYFLTTSYYDVNGIKAQDLNTNTSDYPILKDWADMRKVAGQFRVNFNDYTRKNGLNVVHERQNIPDFYERISKRGNDRVSGVALQWEIALNIGCPEPNYNASQINDKWQD
jgi:hypothetical protein